MRRAFSTLGCPDLPLEEIVALAVKLRVDGAELRAVAGRIDLPEFLAERYGTPTALAAHLGARAQLIVSLSTSLKLAAPTEADRSAFLSFVPWAEALGVRWLRVFDGGAPGAEGPLVDTLQWWRTERARHGWRCDVMIETHDTLFTAEAINSLGARLPGTAILWDAFNTWLKGGEDPLRTWEQIRRHVVHVHVKDALRQPSASFPWTYVLPGQGEFPFESLLNRLRADGFEGPVSLEWEKLWHPYLAPLEEAANAAAEKGWR
ncbi:MAG: sugar phosphate isomerase/epimerase [Opitutus sp.]|nr:sugar phosphate isomerase/epimerase [Opitutus sp.]